MNKGDDGNADDDSDDDDDDYDIKNSFNIFVILNIM
jgi:hypothetical protein